MTLVAVTLVAVTPVRHTALLGTCGSASPKQNHTRLLRRSRHPGSAPSQTPLQRTVPLRRHGHDACDDIKDVNYLNPLSMDEGHF